MVKLSKEILDIVNKQGRVGVLSTADKNGQPNAAYFGSLSAMEDDTVILALGNNRSLKNLEENPLAVFFCVTECPVTFNTPGYRLYLKSKEIQKQGSMLEDMKKKIAELAGEDAAKMIVAYVLFEGTEIRPLVEMG